MFKSDLVAAHRSRQRAPFGFDGNPSHMPPLGAPMQDDGFGMGSLQMPGLIGGFAGGTFDTDGTQVPPVGPGASPEPTAPAPQAGGIFGKSGSAGRKPWQDTVSRIGAALAAFGGNMAPVQMMAQDRRFQEQAAAAAAARQAQWEREDAQRKEGRTWAVEDRDAQLNAPQYFSTGRDRVMFDPRTGESRVVYDGPEDYQTYASVMGYEPGTDEYTSAAQDFVLRGNGPTSFSNDVRMQDIRQRDRLTLRQTPTFRQAIPAPSRSGGGAPRAPTLAGTMAPILSKVARGEPLTAAEQQAWSMYRPGRRGGGTGGPAAAGGSGKAPVRVSSPEQARSLPKGTAFITPEGRVKIR